MRRSRAGIVLLVAAVVAVLLWLVTGCAGGGEGGGGGGEDKAPSGAKTEAIVKTIEVKETEFELQPAEITLDKPGTYVFKAVNSGDTVHALEVEGELTPAGAGAATGRRWTGRVDLATPADATLPMVLVRPDGYVAWATDETAPESRDEALRKALTRWCGQRASDNTGGSRAQLLRAHE